ncbi:unnamed protein product [Gongylonema pulchrum]|uniref:Secreted protein n=1 Tax=Gongylonema pulchrum TaxID=637853 RepID=A0A183DZ79_9BILA|nr:unnamed protein product [Gongylonema pulchrum]
MKLIDAMGYAVGVCASLNGVCHPFIFAFAHRDFKEVLHRQGGLIQKISATSSHFTSGRAPTVIDNISEVGETTATSPCGWLAGNTGIH